MASATDTTAFVIGKWQVRPSSGELLSEGHVLRLEPKMMELLVLLAEHAGQLVSRDVIVTRLWPNTVVGDDTLARTVSKLRKTLGDDGKNQSYVETLPKRGYRLIASVSRQLPATMPDDATVTSIGSSPPATIASDSSLENLPAPAQYRWVRYLLILVPLIAALAVVGYFRFSPADTDNDTQAVTVRANDFYFQYSRAGNESAIALFEQLIARKPEYAPAYAGLANALVQKVVRWQRTPAADGNTTSAPDYPNLGAALASGHTQTALAQQLLSRAQQLAEQAVQLAPDNAETFKALGFVYSAQGKLEAALTAYQQAVSIDHDAWGALINIGDVLEISGRNSEALPYFEAAHAAMTRVYDKQAVRILPWYATLGVLIGDRYQERGDSVKAEHWYRRVLDYAPLHPVATSRMATLLWRAGDTEAARKLCAELRRRVANSDACQLPEATD